MGVLARWEHAAQRWICGRQTCGPQLSRLTRHQTLASTCAWATMNAEVRTAIDSRLQPIAMAATSMRTVLVITQQPFSVVTRFHAPSGDLIGIEQFYVQNGQEIHHPNSVGLHNKNIETDETCA